MSPFATLEATPEQKSQGLHDVCCVLKGWASAFCEGQEGQLGSELVLPPGNDVTSSRGPASDSCHLEPRETEACSTDDGNIVFQLVRSGVGFS